MQARLELVCGDITRQDTEAIVNAANSSLMGGGGVDGAIHRAGGPNILAECKAIVARQGSCQPGQAVITTSGNLLVRYVIHTVGPIWQGGSHGEDAILADAYRNSLQLAIDKGIKTIAFPSISTGAYRFPVDRAAGIALETIQKALHQHPLTLIRMVLYKESDLAVYEKAWSAIKKTV